MLTSSLAITAILPLIYSAQTSQSPNVSTLPNATDVSWPSWSFSTFGVEVHTRQGLKWMRNPGSPVAYPLGTQPVWIQPRENDDRPRVWMNRGQPETLSLARNTRFLGEWAGAPIWGRMQDIPEIWAQGKLIVAGEPLLLSACLDLGVLFYDSEKKTYESRLIDRRGQTLFSARKQESLSGQVFLPMMRTGSTIFGNWVREQDLKNFPPLSGNDYVVRQALAGDIKGPFTQPRRGLGQMGDKFVTAQIWSPLGVPEDTELAQPKTGLFWMSARGEGRAYAPARGEAISDAVLIANSRYVVIQVTVLKRQGSAWSLEGARTEWRFIRLNP